MLGAGGKARGAQARGRSPAPVVGAIALLLIGSLSAAAQQKPLRIGVLAPGPRRPPTVRCIPLDDRQGTPPYVKGLRKELQELGYVEDLPGTQGKPGRRFILDIREGDAEAVKRFAREFAQDQVDLILAISTSSVRAAKEATQASPIPILFPNISDPVGDGFAISLGRPGGFITGVSHQMVQESEKRLERIKELLPGLRRVLIISRATYQPAQRSIGAMRKTAARLHVKLEEKHIKSREDLQAVLAGVRRETVDGIVIPPDPGVIPNANLLLEVGFQRGVPVFGPLDYLADWGALATYGPPHDEAGRRAAKYVDKIVKGEKPGDLPIDHVDPVLVVNLKAAKCLELSLDPAVLSQADRVIQ